VLGSQLAVVHAANPISGIVYRDFNNSGTRDNLPGTFVESLVNGVEVRAYDATGALLECNRSGPTDCTGTADADADGAYSLALPSINLGDTIRIEFVNLPGSLQPGTHSGSGAGGNGTTVRILTGTGAAMTGIDLPLTSPGGFCGAGTDPNPDLLLPCYAIGDQTAADPLVVSFPYNTPNNTDFSVGGGYSVLLDSDEVGAVYGVAYHNLTDTVFMGALVKRHVGTVPVGGVANFDGEANLFIFQRTSGALTRVDLANAPFNLNFGDDGRTAGWNFIGPGNNWDTIGKVGLGDIEVSADGQQIAIVNLNLRQIHIFDIDYGAPAAGSPTGFTPGNATVTLAQTVGPFTPPGGCPNGVSRPFGLSYHDGSLFSGWVCTAENGGTAVDLSAHVFRDGAHTFGMALDFNRSCLLSTASPTCAAGGNNHLGEWSPWSNTFTTQGVGPFSLSDYPQPILVDIEFDSSGDMILGFRDRYGDQVGFLNFSDPANPGTLILGIAGGDLYRACSVNGIFVLEGDVSGNCPQPAAGAGDGDGPNNGQFFWDDFLVGGFGHGETLQGSMVQVPGRPHVVSTTMDPFNYFFNAGGISFMNHTSGAADTNIQLFQGAGTTGKANGLGDIEATCPPPPLEIGNLVWIEDVRDGVQATGAESTVAGIVMELVDPATGNVIATTTTDATGHYYFNAASTWVGGVPVWDSNGNGVADPNEPQGIMAATQYTVRVAASNFDPGQPLENHFLTDVNVGSGVTENGFRLSDSENLSVTFTTGAFGVNNHTLDFGFSPTPPPPPTPVATDVSSFLDTVETLPATGETPWWRNGFLLLFLCIGSVATLYITRKLWSRATTEPSI